MLDPLPCRRPFAGARVAPQQLPYPPAKPVILPDSFLGREAGLSPFGPSTGQRQAPYQLNNNHQSTSAPRRAALRGGGIHALLW